MTTNGPDVAADEREHDGRSQPHAELAPQYYGGQAVIEGVMMRGADRWAVAVRQPDESIWVESHPVSDLPERRPWVGWPLLRGVFTLADSLAIGTKALGIATEKAFPEEEDDVAAEATMAVSMLLALAIFIGVFIVLPTAATKGLDGLLPASLGDGVAFHLIESAVRIAVFLGYLSLISLLTDIRRVFEYHGAEHKTIAAWEHEEVLSPEVVDRYSTQHVRCGTNFLILVMLLAVVIYTLAGVAVPPPADATLLVAVLYHVGLRVVLLPVVAGVAYEGLRLGAAKGDNPVVRAIVAPGLALQKITTRQPTSDQIEVAIRSFQAVVPPELLDGRLDQALTSPLDGPAAPADAAEGVTTTPAAAGDGPTDEPASAEL